MQAIIFGVGQFYKSKKEELKNSVDIVAFIDNNSNLWNTIVDGVEVFSPNQIYNMLYDRIILMSSKAYEMRLQLINMGIDREKIYYYDEHLGSLGRGRLQVFYNERYEYKKDKNAKKILIVSNSLEYNGAPMTAFYAALAMQSKGHQVCIAALSGDKLFIDEMLEQGVRVIIYSNLPFANHIELSWVRFFDIVLINTFPMIKCACEISKIMPAYWWLHESDILYSYIVKQNFELNCKDFYRLKIFAVSEQAKKNFNKYYTDTEVGILTYGIPDMMKKEYIRRKNNKIIFAIIGSICSIKGHDILLEAVRRLDEKEKAKLEVWIIGKFEEESDYCNNIKNILEENNSVKFIGELNRKEMDDIYSYIDVVINPSRQDSCPIVVVEGMMHSKVCITTNVTGMANYIEDGGNGFICESENIDSCYQKIKWILWNKNNLEEIRKNARRTYEKYFTMEDFGNRLDKILCIR